MDPAVIGTAHIGLEAIRRREAAAQRFTDGPSRDRSRPEPHALRSAIARSLRAAANAIDRHPLERAPGA